MKYNCLLFLILLNNLEISSSIKQLNINQRGRNYYRRNSEVFDHSYLTNPVIDSDEFYSKINKDKNKKEEENKKLNYRTVDPQYSINKDGLAMRGDVKECSQNCIDCREGICYKCEKGLYANKNACYETCPFETLADNTSLQCKLEKDNPVYIKAYTISRCVNSCGKTFSDCSCNPRCKKSGDCCSDFQFCEIIEESHTSESTIPNCKFSTLDKSTCLQCKDNFYYYNNTCVIQCNNNTLINPDNKICIDRDNCNLNHCEKCDSKNSKICSQCMNGYFLYKGECLLSCPVGLRANRINFTCQPQSDYSFYWIFPSKYGCRSKCGEQNIKLDCSCRHTCLRRGNCCDNFEKECQFELKKENCRLCDTCEDDGKCSKCKENAVKDSKGECICNDGFKYDLQEDICNVFVEIKNLNIATLEDNLNSNITQTIQKIQKIEIHNTTKNLEEHRNYSANKNDVITNITNNYTNSIKSNLTNHITTIDKIDKIIKDKETSFIKNITELFSITNNSTNSTLINQTSPHNNITIPLSKELLKSFYNNSQLKNPHNKTQIINLYMIGNISINILTNNTNPQLITQNIYNKDSYNSINIEQNLNRTQIPKLQNKTRQIKMRQLKGPLKNTHEKIFNQKNITKVSEVENSNKLEKEENTKTEFTERMFNMTIPNIKRNQTISIFSNISDYLNSTIEPINNEDNIENNKNITNEFLGVNSNNEIKYPIQNNYYITDNSIKIMNSLNPSIIKIDRGNLSLHNDTEFIIIHNKENNSTSNTTIPNNYNSTTTTIIINKNSLIKNITQ